MNIIFSHGKESGPWGSKIRRLAHTAIELGYSVESIDYSDIMDPDARVTRLLDTLKEMAGESDDITDKKFVLVGSSMGGYVSQVAAQQLAVKGAFLLAPALYMPDYAVQTYTRSVPTEVVHGWDDDVIPIDNSIRFGREVGCTVHFIVGDHRLNDSLDEVEGLFIRFLQNLSA